MKRLIAVAVLLFISIGSVHALTSNGVAESEPNDHYLQAMNINSYFAYGTDPDIETGSSGILANYSATIFGEGGGSTYDYYSFSVGTGANDLKTGQILYFDIDDAENRGIDTYLLLFDTNGAALLAENDDAPQGQGPGDVLPVTSNSFLEYTFTDPGTYYITVGEYLGPGMAGPISSLGSYVLHVSAVPIPAAVWLFGSALAGLGLMTRKRKGVEAA
ncbi:MAG: VPLPA-CTERM sorting domain-containing protein [Desulfobulbaceae bacterium]|nr:VPLPA-CTERM sorting domain-containing protein [Desulfobulbaceae bacterium]